MNSKLSDTTILGERTQHRGLKAHGTTPQAWIEGFPVCPPLAERDIIHLGVVSAVKPYRFIRTDFSATIFVACLGGEGRFLFDGEWTACTAGSAFLLLPHAAFGYYAVGKAPWELVWICYQRRDGAPAVGSVSSPAASEYDPMPIFHAVESLRHERLVADDPVNQRHLIDVIHRLVVRYAEPWQPEDRLHQVWEMVAKDLTGAWTLETLARAANCSGEHLRRLCQKTLGRSPMRQVTHLRLRHATELLLGSDHKIETIAHDVGYGDQFAFSAMFKKWIGCPPSEYRAKRLQSAQVDTRETRTEGGGGSEPGSMEL